MRTFMSFLLGGVLGFAGGAGVMLFIFPFLFPPPMVNETIDSGDGLRVVQESSFRQNVAGQDTAHWGRGDLKVYQAADGSHLIELQSNFEVGAGPNFWLYLNSVGDIDDERDFNADADRVRLTKIKSFQGSQVYEIEGGLLADAKALTIWCESFGQYIASANLGA